MYYGQFPQRHIWRWDRNSVVSVFCIGDFVFSLVCFADTRNLYVYLFSCLSQRWRLRLAAPCRGIRATPPYHNLKDLNWVFCFLVGISCQKDKGPPIYPWTINAAFPNFVFRGEAKQRFVFVSPFAGWLRRLIIQQRVVGQSEQCM